MARVLIATPEPVGRRLAGPAIRAAHLARVASAEHEVVLASLAGPSVSPIDGRAVAGPDAIVPEDFDAVIAQGAVTVVKPGVLESETPLVVDWFDPFHLEALHRATDDRIRRVDLIEGARSTLVRQAERGDLFLCSNDAQRKHWLGWLAAVGRVNHALHDTSADAESLIVVAPFGVDGTAPDAPGRIRSTFSVVGAEDPVLLWAGGLHDWLDPVTVIRAMPLALDADPTARLVFLAGPHPNTSIETMGIRGQAIEAARELRLFGKNVLFVNQWVDYTDRLNWVADASVGVVAHADHLETEFSHRTRLLDHLAVGLPTITTTGDPLGSTLIDAGAAIGATPGDIESFGTAMAEVLASGETRRVMEAAAAAMRSQLGWEQTLAPLLDWLESPRRAADSSVITGRGDLGGDGAVGAAIARARLHLDDGGPRQVAERAFGAARRRLGR